MIVSNIWIDYNLHGMKSKKVRRKGILRDFSSNFGIARVLLLSVALVIILVTVVVTYMSGRSFSNMVKSLSTERLVGLAKIADGIMKRANVDKYLMGAPIDENFTSMRAQLKYIVDSTSLDKIGFIRRGPNGDNMLMISTEIEEPFRIVNVAWNDTFEEYETEDKDMTIYVDWDEQVVSLSRTYYDNEGAYAGLIYVSTDFDDFVDEYMEYRNRTIFVVVLTVVIIISVYSVYLSTYLIRPIKEITSETARFAADKDKEIKPRRLNSSRRHDELGVLAKGVTKMETDILEYIDSLTKAHAEKSRVTAELNIASAIQQGMMPTETFPDRKEFEVYASMTPAREVGGDFYDYYFVDPDHLAIVIADVSGKGVPAALFMMVSQMLIRQILTDNPHSRPSEVLMRLDTILSTKNSAEQFVTVWLGILDVHTGRVIASNAGHEYPVLSQGENNAFIAMKDKHNPPVATVEGLQRNDYTFTLRKNDSLLLYTDGVTEATDKDNRLYGMDRLLDCLNAKKESTAQGQVKAVLDSVNSFTGTAEQFDDITLVDLIYRF